MDALTVPLWSKVTSTVGVGAHHMYTVNAGDASVPHARGLFNQAAKHFCPSVQVSLDQFASVTALEELVDKRKSLIFGEIPCGHLSEEHLHQHTRRICQSFEWKVFYLQFLLESSVCPCFGCWY